MALFKKVTAGVKKVLTDKEIKEVDAKKKEEGLKKAAEAAAAQLKKEAEGDESED